MMNWFDRLRGRVPGEDLEDPRREEANDVIQEMGPIVDELKSAVMRMERILSTDRSNPPGARVRRTLNGGPVNGES